jgi:hypothetical protein
MKKKRDYSEKVYCQGESLFDIDRKKEEKDQKHEDRGSNPKESYPFPLISNGEINTRRERSGPLVTGGV